MPREIKWHVIPYNVCATKVVLINWVPFTRGATSLAQFLRRWAKAHDDVLKIHRQLFSHWFLKHVSVFILKNLNSLYFEKNLHIQWSLDFTS